MQRRLEDKYGFTINPETGVSVVEEQENKYRFEFNWGASPLHTFYKKEHKDIVSKFINRLYENSFDFNKDSEQFFRRGARNEWGFLYTFVESKGKPAGKVTWKFTGEDGNTVKGKNYSKQLPDMYDAYMELVKQYDIPIALPNDVKSLLCDKNNVVYSIFQKGLNPNFYQLSIVNKKNLNESIYDFNITLNEAFDILFLYFGSEKSVTEINKLIPSVFSERTEEDIKDVVYVFSNGYGDFLLNKQKTSQFASRSMKLKSILEFGDINGN